MYSLHLNGDIMLFSQTATGLDVKKALHQQDSSLEPHLLRLVAPGKFVKCMVGGISQAGLHLGGGGGGGGGGSHAVCRKSNPSVFCVSGP